MHTAPFHSLIFFLLNIDNSNKKTKKAATIKAYENMLILLFAKFMSGICRYVHVYDVIYEYSHILFAIVCIYAK